MAKNDKAFDPRIPSDSDALIAWAKQRKEEAHRIPEREAFMNLAFMLGQQWVVWDATQRRLDQPRNRRGDPNAPVRITVNKMGALAERTVSRLTKSAPVPECRPVTNEERDVSAAKVGTRILQHELHRLHWMTELPRLYFWVLPLGWSFMHLYWDAEKGPRVDTPDMPTEDGEPVYQGDICMEVVPGSEIVLDPNARTWDEARWVIRTVNMTRSAIYEMYGVSQVDGEVESRDLAMDIYRLQDGTTSDAERRRKDRSDQIAVNQLWVKPGGRAKPEGLVFTWAGGTVLEGPMPFPYDHGQLPFVPFSLLPGLGFPEGRTWMSDLRGMQSDYNDARSREATIRRTLVPKLLAARGQIDPSRLSSRVEVVEYAPTGPEPQWSIPNGQWMQQFEQAMNRADMEMGDRAGQAEVSQGRAPAGAPAAAILALQEADESKLAVSAKELAASTERVGYQILMLARQFWDEQRQVRCWSESGKLEVSRFQGSDIQDQLDVHVSSESMLPKSKSARAQLALDLWDRQILTDPAAFIRMIEVPGVSFLQEQFDLDTRQAEREYGRVLTGMPISAQDWENHPVHITQHNNDRKTEEWEDIEDRAAAGDPEAQAIVTAFEQHVAEHYAWMQYQASGVVPPGFAGGMVPGMAPAGPEGEPGNMPGGGGPAYLDPLTGRPPDPLAVAAGQSPSGLAFNPPPGIGGAVPGIPTDQQSAQTGN